LSWFRNQFASGEDERVVQLSVKLSAFYGSPGEYSAFLEPNWKPEYWAPIKQSALERVNKTGQCRILEIGAGCTSFGSYLGNLRARVEFHAQDITPANQPHLATQADAVFIADVRSITDKYDIIFSTFAWEHLCNPKKTMHHLTTLLKPDGSIFVASPRYDFPFYLSPSARHLTRGRKVAIAIWVLWRRVRVLLGGRADFLIHLDPAVLRSRWFRDSDAVHWVSLWDLKREFAEHYEIKRIRISANGVLGRFWEKYLLLFVVITPRNGGPGK
jgi:SAM-dependent methyltransferase